MFRFKRKVGGDSQPEIMIVGLGNPGPEYKGTRHNVGFEVIDLLAERHKVRGSTFKHQARYSIGPIGPVSVILVKPMTFMNLSGKAVAALSRTYKIPPERILVVSDDLDLDTGKTKMKPKGGSGGHNGHKSIIALLHTEEYPRLKIGIGKSEDTVDHVLTKFQPEEREHIQRAVLRAVDACTEFVSNGLDAAMRVCNA